MDQSPVKITIKDGNNLDPVSSASKLSVPKQDLESQQEAKQEPAIDSEKRPKSPCTCLCIGITFLLVVFMGLSGFYYYQNNQNIDRKFAAQQYVKELNSKLEAANLDLKQLELHMDQIQEAKKTKLEIKEIVEETPRPAWEESHQDQNISARGHDDHDHNHDSEQVKLEIKEVVETEETPRYQEGNHHSHDHQHSNKTTEQTHRQEDNHQHEVMSAYHENENVTNHVLLIEPQEAAENITLEHKQLTEESWLEEPEELTLGYQGEQINGTPNGQGVYQWGDGTVYMGAWQDGKMHGFGVKTYPDGTTYEGMFEKGKRQGYGVLLDKNNKITQDGQWIDDEFDFDV